MTTATEELVSMVDAEDPYDHRAEDLRERQIAALEERFTAARKSIAVVDHRARDASIDRIKSPADLLPLMFSDASYKAYPESYVTKGQWRNLGAWVDALSTSKGIREVNTDGVTNIDEWLARLREAGHYVYVSSGTSGRCSLFKVSQGDREMDVRVFRAAFKWATGAVPDHSREVFAMFPPAGYHRIVDALTRVADDFGQPGGAHFLGEEPLRVTDVNHLGGLRRAMAQGTATPSQIRAFEERTAERQAAMAGALERMADLIVQHHDRPLVFLGTWAPFFALIQAAKARGLVGGIHPRSIVFSAGGLKGAVLPADYREQIQKALGLGTKPYLQVYGVSELTTTFPMCAAGRFHSPPWMIPLVVDKEGEHLVEPADGRATGRMALFDLSLEARWGGLITGDRVTVDTGPCECGRRGTTVINDIVRYIDLPEGDDKITCAGTVDAYVRGLIGDEA